MRRRFRQDGAECLTEVPNDAPHRLVGRRGSGRVSTCEVRALVAADVGPDDVVWEERSQGDLLGMLLEADGPAISLPRKLGELVQRRRATQRSGALRACSMTSSGVRCTASVHAGIEIASDPDRASARDKWREVGAGGTCTRCMPIVRFRPIVALDGGPERYVAWFEPDHFILEADDPRSSSTASARWCGRSSPRSARSTGTARRLTLRPARHQAATHRPPIGFEEGWTGYYESTFNPARAPTPS